MDNNRDSDMQDIQTINEKQREEGINRIECHNEARYKAVRYNSSSKKNSVETYAEEKLSEPVWKGHVQTP